MSDGLKKSTENATKVNQGIYSTFDQQMKSNPAKVKEWYEKAQHVRQMSDSLYNLAEELKEAIVKEADGKDADVNNIQNREDLEASTQVMLAPGKGRGKEGPPCHRPLQPDRGHYGRRFHAGTLPAEHGREDIQAAEL